MIKSYFIFVETLRWKIQRILLKHIFNTIWLSDAKESVLKAYIQVALRTERSGIYMYVQISMQWQLGITGVVNLKESREALMEDAKCCN